MQAVPAGAPVPARPVGMFRRGGAGQDIGEPLRPGLLHPQRHGVGQVALVELGRALRTLERPQTVTLRHAQVHAEARDLVHQPPSRPGRRLEQVVEQDIEPHQPQQQDRHRPGGGQHVHAQRHHFEKAEGDDHDPYPLRHQHEDPEAPAGEPDGEEEERGGVLGHRQARAEQRGGGERQPGHQVAAVVAEVGFLVLALQGRLQGLDGGGDDLVVGFLQRHALALVEELLRQGPLAAGESRLAGAGLALQHVAVTGRLGDGEIALHRQADERGGEGAVVEAHAVEIAGARGGDPRRRLVERDHRPAEGIAPHPRPGDEVEARHNRQPQRPQQGAAVVAQEPARPLHAGGLAHVALGPGHHDGEAFPGAEAPGGLEHRPPRAVRAGAPVASLRALRAGVGDELAGRGAPRQRHPRAGVIDGEVPAVAGDVPVELVMVVEEPQLPIGAVAQGIGVLAGGQEDVAAPQVDAHAVGERLGAPVLRGPVAGGGEHLEVHHGLAAEAVAVAGGKVAVDAAADIVPLGAHGDGLAHHHAPVGVDGDVAVEIENALGREGGGEDEQERDEQERTEPHRRTSGGWRSAASSTSKYSAGRKRNSPATRLPGKDCTSTLSSRTAPL